MLTKLWQSHNLIFEGMLGEEGEEGGVNYERFVKFLVRSPPPWAKMGLPDTPRRSKRLKICSPSTK